MVVRLPLLRLAPFVLCVALYFPVLRQHLLSDDMAVTYALSEWLRNGELWPKLWSKFGAGLDSPSFYYRPLTFLSFGVNFALSGTHPPGWHLVNLVGHLLAGAAVYRIAMLLQPPQASRAAAIFAAALFLLWGTGVEAVAWVSGRYDVFATMLLLWSAAFYLRSHRVFDGHGLAALLAGMLALCSKESAAVLPGLIGCLAWIRHGVLPRRERWIAIVRDLLPWLAVIAAYFALRFVMFGSMFQVYPEARPLERIAGGAWLPALDAALPWIVAALPQPRALAAAAALLFAIALAVVASSLADRMIGRASVGLALAFLSTLALLLPHLSGLSPRGEGGRLFYTSGALLALWLALPFAHAGAEQRPRRVLAMAALAFVVLQAVLLHAALRDWREAGRQMQALVTALPALERRLAPGGYAFVFAPDSIGAVPFARNANGALVLPPVQSQPLLKRMLVFLPADIPNIPGLLSRRLVPALKQHALDDAASVMREADPSEDPASLWPSDLFCWRTDTAALAAVAVVEPWRDAARWNETIREALRRAGCAWVD